MKEKEGGDKMKDRCLSEEENVIERNIVTNVQGEGIYIEESVTTKVEKMNEKGREYFRMNKLRQWLLMHSWTTKWEQTEHSDGYIINTPATHENYQKGMIATKDVLRAVDMLEKIFEEAFKNDKTNFTNYESYSLFLEWFRDKPKRGVIE